MTKTKTYRGIHIDQTENKWTVWDDFVTERHFQPRFATLAMCRKFINSLGIG